MAITLKVNSFTNASRWVDSVAGRENVVAEEEVGRAVSGELFFPNVQSCTAIVAMTNSGVFGTHITIATSTHQMRLLVAKLRQLAYHMPVTQLWAIGGLYATGSGWMSQYPRRKDMRAALRHLMRMREGANVRVYRQPKGSSRYYKVVINPPKLDWWYHVAPQDIGTTILDHNTIRYKHLSNWHLRK